MSTSQKLLIASGVLTVVSIVAIAAFSLGVYVGERGWTAGPPAMAGPGGLPKAPAGGQPPGQQPPGGQQPPSGQPGQPPGRGPDQPPPGDQPGQPPVGGPGQPSFGPPGDLPPGRPDVIGRVQSVAGDSITLNTPQGPRLVTVNDETEVRRAEGEEEASLEDIGPDTHIAVFGQLNGGGKTLVAQVIVILSPPPKR